MADKRRVGVIGRTDKGGYGHGIDTVWKHIPDLEVVAVADEHDAGRAKAKETTGAAATYADYRDMLAKENLEIVGIGPRWIDQHRDMVLDCARHGCHIYMEKPFCRTPAEADEIIHALEMRHLRLAIAHQTHYAPTLDVVKDLIQTGEIGDLLELRGRGKEDATRGGGEDLWVLGSHILDLMRYLGGDPLDCYATMFANRKPVTKADVKSGNEGLGPLAGDHVQATYTFPNGVTGFFGSKRAAAGSPSRFGLQIFGSKGIIEIFTGYPAQAFILKDSSWSPGRSNAAWQPVTSNGIGKPETLSGGLDGGNVAAVKDLLRAIDDHREPKCGPTEGRWTVEMICAIFESHRVGKPVKFPLEQRENALTLLK
jgi:predicted dehydrogenase